MRRKNVESVEVWWEWTVKKGTPLFLGVGKRKMFWGRG